MKKVLTTSLVITALLQGVAAYADSSYEDLYFDNSKNIPLSEKEFETLQKQKAWENNHLQNSYVGKNGEITFTYGVKTPTLVCAVLQITDLELEMGETINSVNLGDATRWSVEPAITGTGSASIQHILIKPLDVGLNTSMMIATDRRSYRLNLKSTRNDFMSYVKFAYPEKIQAQFAEKQRILQKERDDNSIRTVGSETGYLSDLNFNYEIDGNVSWKPIRVFDDGTHTIIELPESVKAQKAPALMVLLEEGGLFTDEKTELINYRLQGSRYIVDGIFDKALLTLDLDSNQQRVVMTRGK